MPARPLPIRRVTSARTASPLLGPLTVALVVLTVPACTGPPLAAAPAASSGTASPPGNVAGRPSASPAGTGAVSAMEISHCNGQNAEAEQAVDGLFVYGVAAPLVVGPGGRIDVLFWTLGGDGISHPAVPSDHIYFTSSADRGRTWSAATPARCPRRLPATKGRSC